MCDIEGPTLVIDNGTSIKAGLVGNDTPKVVPCIVGRSRAKVLCKKIKKRKIGTKIIFNKNLFNLV